MAAASRPNVASSKIVEKKIGQNDHMDKENVVDSNNNDDGSGSNNVLDKIGSKMQNKTAGSKREQQPGWYMLPG